MKSISLRALARAQVPYEVIEAKNLMQWAHYRLWSGHRLSDLLIMIPNGAYLGADPRQRKITMSKLKRSGFKSGVFDYLLPVPDWEHRSPGLWLELKRQKFGVVSDEQKNFRDLMERLGWACRIADGWSEASFLIQGYLMNINGNTSVPIANDSAT